MYILCDKNYRRKQRKSKCRTKPTDQLNYNHKTNATIDTTSYNENSLQFFYFRIDIFNTDVFLEGECYGKLAVSIRPVKNYIRIVTSSANTDQRDWASSSRDD